MMDETTYTYSVVTQIQEETESFIFEVIQPFCEKTAKCELSKDDLRRACALLLAERSGQIEARKTGKWLKDIYGNVVCSECRTNRRDNRVGHIAFCNSCGAKMEVDE